MLTEQSGLLGLAGSADMRTLLADPTNFEIVSFESGQDLPISYIEAAAAA
jgi:acetate kinase